MVKIRDQFKYVLLTDYAHSPNLVEKNKFQLTRERLARGFMKRAYFPIR